MMAAVADIVRHGPAAPIDHERLIRLLDAEMLESVGQPVPDYGIDAHDGDQASDHTSAARRFIPIASIGLAASAISVLILARFSGM